GGALATHIDRPSVRDIDARDGFDEGRFASAVIADQADDLTGIDLEIDIAERLYSSECLGDARDAQRRLAALGSLALRAGGTAAAGVGGSILSHVRSLPRRS